MVKVRQKVSTSGRGTGPTVRVPSGTMPGPAGTDAYGPGCLGATLCEPDFMGVDGMVVVMLAGAC